MGGTAGFFDHSETLDKADQELTADEQELLAEESPDKDTV